MQLLTFFRCAQAVPYWHACSLIGDMHISDGRRSGQKPGTLVFLL